MYFWWIMLYFAYGSNLSLEHMRRLAGRHLVVYGSARLPDFDLEPDKRGYLTVRPKAGAEVWGALYDVTEEAMGYMDRFEGYPEVFDRKEVEVVDNAGNKKTAWVYLETPDQYGGQAVREEYMRRVLSGAVDNHLPESWVEFLRKFKVM